MSDRFLRVRMIFEAMDKFTAPIRGMATGSDHLSAKVKATRAELTQLNTTSARLAAFRDLKKSSQETAIQMQAAQTKAAALGRELAQTEKPTRAMKRAFKAAKAEALGLQDRHTGQVNALKNLRNELSAAGISTRNMAGHERELRSSIERTTDELNQQTRAMDAAASQRARMSQAQEQMGAMQSRAGAVGAAGAGALGAGVALAAPIAAATREASSFRDGMIDVTKVLRDVSPEQVTQLESQLSGLANRLPIAREGVVQIAAEFARAGVPAHELAGYTENAAMMAAAFDIEASQAGAMMATWRTGMKLSGPEVVALGDRVNALTNSFGGSAPAVAEMITRIGPLGDVAGASGGALAAMAQLMNSVGVASEIGATGIKNTLLAMTKGEAATKTQHAAFDALGLSAVDMAERMQTDANGAILQVLESIAKLPKAQQAGVLTQLFGSESVAAIAPLLSNLDQLRANFAMVGDASQTAGSLNNEFNTAMGKTSNQTQVARNALGGLGKVMGGPWDAALRGGAGLVSSLATGLTKWAEKHPKLSGAISITVGVMAGLLMVIGGLLIAAAAIMAPLALIPVIMAGWASAGLFLAPMLAGIGAGIVTATGAVWGFTAALLANPLTWVVLAIIAFAAAAVYLVIKNWDRIVPWVRNLWGNIKTGFVDGMGHIVGAITGFGARFLTLGGGLVAALARGILAAPGAVWSAIKSVVSGALDRARSMVGLGPATPSGNPALPVGTQPVVRPAIQRRASGGAFGPGWLLTGERGAEIEYANRSGYIAHAGQVERLAAMTAASAAILSMIASPATAASSPIAASNGGGARRAEGAAYEANHPPITVHNTYQITITTQAQDPRAVAREVEQAISRLNAQSNANARSRFDYDGNDEA